MQKKNFLFLSYDALINDAAWMVVKEGHNAKFYIENKKYQAVGDGFIPKVSSWRDHLQWADVVIFDDVLGHSTLADEVRQKGKLVIGGTPYTDRFETIGHSDKGYWPSTM